MSGGVDSSVAAALLLEAGYDPVGCFMRLGSPGEALDALVPEADAFRGVACDPAAMKIGKQGCCSVGDAADARLVAAQLGIPFYVCNFKKDFGRIIDYFTAEYAAGRTPNPCVRCNDWLKFGKLHEYAEQIGAEFVASGHYARREADGDGGWTLRRGVDHHKDQSYVLFGAKREQLGKMMLPVGGFTKPQIRALAEELNLPVFDKPDSQEICFVPDNDYAGLIERRDPSLSRPGSIVDSDGNTVGTHGGQHKFTIGQRRGVGVALGYPIYVVDKDPVTNTVTVGSNDDLQVAGCVVGEANWLVGDDVLASMRHGTECLAQIRYNGEPVATHVQLLETNAAEVADEPTPSGRTGRFIVEFVEPQRAVAPGQACVLYDTTDTDRVLGGGWIAKAIRHDSCTQHTSALSQTGASQ